MLRFDASPHSVRVPRVERPRLTAANVPAALVSLFFVACSAGASSPLAPPSGATRPTPEPVPTSSAAPTSTAGTATPDGHVRTPVDPRPEHCASDEDCVVTTFASCCHPCGGGDSRAELRWRAKDAEESCAAVKCPQRPPVACAPPRRHAYERAVCRAGACLLDITPPHEPETGLPVDEGGPLARGCTRDADCAASTFDGCCTACTCPEPHPILKVNLARESAACRVVECPRGDSKTCLACSPVAPMEPACRNARCVLVPR